MTHNDEAYVWPMKTRPYWVKELVTQIVGHRLDAQSLCCQVSTGCDGLDRKGKNT